MPKKGKSLKSKDRPSVERGLAPGWTRASIIVRKKHLGKLRALVYWTPGATIKELVDNALGDYLKGKKAKAVPKGPGNRRNGSQEKQGTTAG